MNPWKQALLETARLRLGLTSTDEVATRAGTSRTTLFRWARDEELPLETALRILLYLFDSADKAKAAEGWILLDGALKLLLPDDEKRQAAKMVISVLAK